MDHSAGEGVRALWKGLGPNLIGVVPARAIYFGVYSKGKQVLTRWNQKETPLVHVISAAMAGTSVAVVTNPIWLVKTRMVTSPSTASTLSLQLLVNNSNSKVNCLLLYIPSNASKNSFHCAYSVVQEEGIRGLYRGLSASILGLSESTLQFATYEALKKLFREQRSGKDSSQSSRTSQDSEWAELFAAAAIAKLGAAILTYPHEVIRTRLRQSPSIHGEIKYRSLAQCARLVYKEEGMAAFYGGMTAHLMRVVPNAAILFFTYEMLVHLWKGSKR